MEAHILVVEDSDNLRLLVQTLLEQMKAKVAAVSNGIEAIEHFKKHDKIDLILLDVMMPGMDGLRFLKNIKDLKKEKDIKVCMMTAKRDAATVQTAISLGANDYIVKPIDKEILGEKVKQLLGENFSNPFATTKVNIKAQLFGLPVKVPLTIKEVSEIEIKIISNVEFDDENEITFYSPTLASKAGEDCNFSCKVISCNKIADQYNIEARFIGLTEKLRTVLRQIAINQEEIDDEK